MFNRCIWTSIHPVQLSFWILGTIKSFLLLVNTFHSFWTTKYFILMIFSPGAVKFKGKVSNVKVAFGDKDLQQYSLRRNINIPWQKSRYSTLWLWCLFWSSVCVLNPPLKHSVDSQFLLQDKNSFCFPKAHYYTNISFSRLFWTCKLVVTLIHFVD